MSDEQSPYNVTINGYTYLNTRIMTNDIQIVSTPQESEDEEEFPPERVLRREDDFRGADPFVLRNDSTLGSPVYTSLVQETSAPVGGRRKTSCRRLEPQPGYPERLHVDRILDIKPVYYRPTQYLIIEDDEHRWYRVKYSTLIRGLRVGIEEFRVEWRRTWYHLVI